MNPGNRVAASSLLTAVPAMSQPASNQVAGQINALIPAATRNSQTAKVKEELDWNDLLKTENTGRIRAGLTDGSILSVGSDSELRIVQQPVANAHGITQRGDHVDAAARQPRLFTEDVGDGLLLSAQGRRVVAAYDWPVVAATVVKVYDTVVAADPRAVVEAD